MLVTLKRKSRAGIPGKRVTRSGKALSQRGKLKTFQIENETLCRGKVSSTGCRSMSHREARATLCHRRRLSYSIAGYRSSRTIRRCNCYNCISHRGHYASVRSDHWLRRRHYTEIDDLARFLRARETTGSNK